MKFEDGVGRWFKLNDLNLNVILASEASFCFRPSTARNWASWASQLSWQCWALGCCQQLWRRSVVQHQGGGWPAGPWRNEWPLGRAFRFVHLVWWFFLSSSLRHSKKSETCAKKLCMSDRVCAYLLGSMPLLDLLFHAQEKFMWFCICSSTASHRKTRDA